MKFSLPLTTFAAAAFTMMSLPAVSATDLWKDLAVSHGSTKNSTSTTNLRRRMPSVPISPSCNPDDAFMIFNGHNQATSVSTGNVVISWSPPFVAKYVDQEFIYCGGFTYYIFTSKHETEDVFLERVNNKSIPELIEMANADPDDDFFLDVTTDLSFEWKRFTPGIDYTMLVTAATNEGILTTQGIESMNREPARLLVSSVVPKLKTNVNGRKLVEGESPVIEVPTHPTDTFATEVIASEGIEEYTVIFHDNVTLPDAINKIETGLYFYAEGVSKIGSADLVKCVLELNVATGLPVDASYVAGTYVKACTVVKGDLGDIFDELDASADFFDDTNEIAESMEELTPEEEEEAESFLDGLDPEALLNLCISSNPDLENKEEECLADITSQFEEEVLAGNGGRKLRRLRCCRRFRRRMKKVGRTIKKTATKVAKAVKEALDIKIVLKDTTITLIDIDAGGRMTCEAEGSGSDSDSGVKVSESIKSEIGVNLDFSAHMRFGITVKTLSGVEKAHASLFGGFGAKSYIMFQSTHKITFQPEPYEIFKKSSHKVFMAGPVPVVITIRPSLSAFAEAAMVIESDVLLEGQFGYDWEFGFSFHKDTGTKKVSKFVKRNEDKRSPVFDLRLNAAAEMGLTFAIDVVLYGVLQGTLAADTGFGAEIEATANVAALFDENQHDLYSLNAELEAFIRIRGFVGLNSEISNVIRDATKDLNNKDERKCEWKFAKYRVPELPQRDDPDLIAEAVEAAKNMDFEEIDVNGILDSLGDTYSPDRGALQGQNLDFGKNFEIFSVDFMLFNLVHESGVSCASLTCDAGDECTVSKCVDGLGCISEGKDCGPDSQCVVGRGCVSNHVLSLCAEGTISSNFAQCCGKCNGLCGGPGCNRRPGGSSKCCNGTIGRNNRICKTPFDTGCIMPQ